VSPSEYDDEYSESLETEFRRLEAALLSDKVTLLAPSAPIHLAATATVAEALDQMIAKRRTAVVVVDGEGGSLASSTSATCQPVWLRPGAISARPRSARS
jgi:CBS domain-containing protein